MQMYKDSHINYVPLSSSSVGLLSASGSGFAAALVDSAAFGTVPAKRQIRFQSVSAFYKVIFPVPLFTCSNLPFSSGLSFIWRLPICEEECEKLSSVQ